METPSSTSRRVTRSQTLSLSASNNNIPRKIDDSEKNMSKTRQRNVQQQQDRCALVDISNDSPIVGLANGNGCDLETPLSSLAKQRGSRVKKTPGSGEALLRGQVKTLLQKVEEEAEISRLSMDIRPFLQFANSPMSLLAPTPANTPQISNSNGAIGLPSVSPSPSSVVQEQLISQMVNQTFDGNDNKEDTECEKIQLSRSLLLDFSDKSEVTECTSELGDSSVEKPQGSTEDDGDSIWSIQVNASTHDEEEDDDETVENEEEDYEGVEEEEEYDDLEELCAGFNNMGVEESVVPKFSGKHTRFVYNSEDELVEEVEIQSCAENGTASSSDIVHLKGLPTPKGKHIRFSEEEEKSVL